MAAVVIGLWVGNDLLAQGQIQVDLPSAFVQNSLTGKSGLPSNVVGSPYLNENFSYGRVLVEGQDSYRILLRYNAYRDQMEMKNPDESLTALLKKDYIEVQMNNELWVVRGFDNNGSLGEAYFVRIEEVGEFELLLRKNKVLREGREATSSYTNATPPRFDEDFGFYLKHKDEIAKPVKLKKNSVIEALPEEFRDKAEELIKKNKWKLKDESELGELLKALSV